MRVSVRNYKRGALFALIPVLLFGWASIKAKPGEGLLHIVMMLLWGGLVFWFASKQRETEAIARCIEIARQSFPAFTMTKYMFGLGGNSGIFLDEAHQRVMLFESNGAKVSVVPESQIVRCEVSEDGALVSSTSTGFGKAVVGGLAFGGVGLVAGSLLGTKEQRTKTELSEVLLKVVLNDRSNPIFRMDLFKAPKPVDRNSPRVKAALRVAEDAETLLGMLGSKGA